VVLREGGCAVWLRTRLFPADQNTNFRRPCLWHRRSINSISYHQDNRSSTATNWRYWLERGFCRRPDRMAPEEGRSTVGTVAYRPCEREGGACGRESAEHIHASEEVHIDQAVALRSSERRNSIHTSDSSTARDCALETLLIPMFLKSLSYCNANPIPHISNGKGVLGSFGQLHAQHRDLIARLSFESSELRPIDNLAHYVYHDQAVYSYPSIAPPRC